MSASAFQSAQPLRPVFVSAAGRTRDAPTVTDDTGHMPHRSTRHNSVDCSRCLIALVATGDHIAFARLYDKLAPVVHGIATRRVQNPSDVAAVTHASFLEVWRQAPRFNSDEGGHVRTWVALIAHRRAVDHALSAAMADSTVSRS